MRYHGDSNPYNVDALWEVRLRPEIVHEIRIVAKKYGKTMSWVVRFCAFRLYRRKKNNPTELQAMADEMREKNQVKPLSSKELHRLRVCLYGDDERIFLELKYRYRLTTTMLIRIALRLYIKNLQNSSTTSWDFFYWGLKFFASTKLVYSSKFGIPQADFHFKQFMDQVDFWGRPPGPLPDYLCI